MAERRLALRRDDTCARCGFELAAGTHAWWDSTARSVTCLACHGPSDDGASAQGPSIEPAGSSLPPPPPPPLASRGIPGASARKEGDRRSTKREQAILARHPRMGRLLAAVTDDPVHTQVWFRGAVGEERVGRTLEEARAKGVEVLHDCRIPRSRANIDHLVVAPTGVWVVDAKRYVDKKLERRDVGGWRRADHRLFVGGRDRSDLVAAVTKQTDRVALALASTPYAGLPVHGALCFVDVQVGLFGKPFRVDEVLVTWRGELVAPLVGADGPSPVLQQGDIDPVARHLAAAFPPQAF